MRSSGALLQSTMDRTYQLNGAPKPTQRRFADLSGPDFFPTPRWATFALIDNERFEGDIWECACGDGAMSRVLAETGSAVISTDLYDRGYGESGHDFLNANRGAENIVTNPPFNSAEGFVTSATQRARRKVALLLRLAFLEGANRACTIFAQTPPSRVWVFSERITFYPSGVEPKAMTPPPTLGSYGTRVRQPAPRTDGSSPATRPITPQIRGVDAVPATALDRSLCRISPSQICERTASARLLRCQATLTTDAGGGPFSLPRKGEARSLERAVGDRATRRSST